jgi:hypothetical protein
MFNFQKVRSARRIRELQRLKSFFQKNNELARERAKRTSTGELEDMAATPRLAEQHNLDPSQERVMRSLLQQGSRGQRRSGMRQPMQENGCLIAVRYGRMGNRHWGLSVRAKKGGYARVRSIVSPLSEISRRGVLVRQANIAMRRRYGRGVRLNLLCSLTDNLHRVCGGLHPHFRNGPCSIPSRPFSKGTKLFVSQRE